MPSSCYLSKLQLAPASLTPVISGVWGGYDTALLFITFQTAADSRPTLEFIVQSASYLGMYHMAYTGRDALTGQIFLILAAIISCKQALHDCYSSLPPCCFVLFIPASSLHVSVAEIDTDICRIERLHIVHRRDAAAANHRPQKFTVKSKNNRHFPPGPDGIATSSVASV